MQTDPLWRFYPTIKIGKQAHVIAVSPIHICETGELLRVSFQDCPETKDVHIAHDIDIDITNPCFISFWSAINKMKYMVADFTNVENVKHVSYLLDYFNVTDQSILDAFNEKIVNFKETPAHEGKIAVNNFIIPKLEKYLNRKHEDAHNLIDLDIDEYVDNLTILLRCTGDMRLLSQYVYKLFKPANTSTHEIYNFDCLLYYLQEHLTDERKVTMAPYQEIIAGLRTFVINEPADIRFVDGFNLEMFEV